MQSNVQQRGAVKFPQFLGERVYMREFTKSGGLPNDLERWQGTIDQMLDGIDAPGSIFLMIDQAEVKAGASHRRGGVHVDGYWNKALHAHGGGHRGGRHVIGEAYEPEALILATDVMASYAYLGEYDDAPRSGGDCAHIDVSGMLCTDIEPSKVWAGHTLTFLHEAVPVAKDCKRTLVRLNIPGWVPNVEVRG